MLTATGAWWAADHIASASTIAGGTILTAKARPTSGQRSDLRAANRSKPNATAPIATASRAVPGTWPDDSEA